MTFVTLNKLKYNIIIIKKAYLKSLMTTPANLESTILHQYISSDDEDNRYQIDSTIDLQPEFSQINQQIDKIIAEDQNENKIVEDWLKPVYQIPKGSTSLSRDFSDGTLLA